MECRFILHNCRRFSDILQPAALTERFLPVRLAKHLGCPQVCVTAQVERFKLTTWQELVECVSEVIRSLVGLLDFKSSGGYRMPAVGSIPIHFRQ